MPSTQERQALAAHCSLTMGATYGEPFGSSTRGVLRARSPLGRLLRLRTRAGHLHANDSAVGRFVSSARARRLKYQSCPTVQLDYPSTALARLYSARRQAFCRAGLRTAHLLW